MPEYEVKSDDSNESEYESDGGTHYKFQKKLGTGAYSEARAFSSPKPYKKIAVLSPVSTKTIDEQELKAKYIFFKTIYSSYNVELIRINGTYRLITPLIPGKPFKSLSKHSLTEERQQITMILSAIKAIKNCHEKGLIICDLKEDNIHFDSNTGISYLIDGGLSAVKGNNINSVFTLETVEAIAKYKKKSSHIAPECWSTTTVPATTCMDVYSLGNMLGRMFRSREITLSPQINSLLQECQHQDPAQRPTLDLLKNKIEMITVIKNIQKITVTFNLRWTLEGIDQQRTILSRKVDQESENLLKAFTQLRDTGVPQELIQAINNKKNEIEFQAELSYQRLLEKTQKHQLILVLDKLKANILTKEHYRKTNWYSGWKSNLLDEIKKDLLAENALDLDIQAYIDRIRTVCSKKRNILHFWATPHSLDECNRELLKYNLIEAIEDRAVCRPTIDCLH